jgi:hypothetical protein
MNFNWVSHILSRNCLVKRIAEGKIIGKDRIEGRRGRRNKQLLDYLKEKIGYWKLKEETQIALGGELALEEAMELI